MRDSRNYNEESYNGGGSNGSSNLLYLLAGCGIGGTLALLFAPKSGVELRSDISDITRKGYNETLELAGEMKERSAELYHSIRQSADRVYDLAATKLSLAEKTIEDSQQLAGDIVNGEIGRKAGKSPQTSPGTDNMPSNTF